MLSLLKKNSNKTKAQQTPAWHLNFRNFAALPDTKLVRTSFFVNGLLILVAVAALLGTVYQELTISDLGGQLEKAQDQVKKNEPASSKAIAQYKLFQAAEQRISELNTFVKGQKIVFSDLIIHLSQTKPTTIVFLEVSYNDTGVGIKGYVQGISEQATIVASAYEKQLKEDPQFNKIFKVISMTNVNRDPQASRLVFDIVMSFTQGKGK